MNILRDLSSFSPYGSLSFLPVDPLFSCHGLGMAWEKASVDNGVPRGMSRRRMRPGVWGCSPPPSPGEQCCPCKHMWLLPSPPCLDASFSSVPVGVWKTLHGGGSGLKSLNVLETPLSQWCGPSSLLRGREG